MADIHGYLADDERVVEENSDNYLTNFRLIKYSTSGQNIDYKEIQLDKIDSFEYKKRFNYILLSFGGMMFLGGLISTGLLSGLIYGIGICLIGAIFGILAILTSSKEYTVKSASGTNISLDSNSDSIDFWKSVINQRNERYQI